MKKTIIFLGLICCFFSTTLETNANTYCSPIKTPFKDLLEDYNTGGYIIVEGYFQKDPENHYTSTFNVTRSSDTSIKINQAYDVFEYGPFGSECEMYEMEANLDPEQTGKKNPRLLVLYKTMSENGKLVTPIFWEAGVNTSKNKIVIKEYEEYSREYNLYESTSSLEEIWEQILSKNALALEWKKSVK